MKAHRSFKVLALFAAVLLSVFALSRAPAGQAATPAAPQTTVTLTAVADATLKSWQANTNYGSDSTLTAGHSHIDVDENAVVLVRFDLSSLPADAIIDSANIQLYLESSGGLDPVTLSLKLATSAWSESTVTWNTAPTTAPVGLTWQIDANPGYKSHDLSSWATYWMDNPNYGVMLLGPLTGDFYQRLFSSRERGSNPPGLVVTYHLPPPPVLSGSVYAGSAGDESTPLSGVTVALYGSNNQNVQGTLMSSTTTDAHGAYSLTVSSVYEFYSIIETDPPGYYSVAATTIGGAVINANWIQYAYPLTSKTLTGNKFWDQPGTPLQITSGPQVVNLGQGTATITWTTDRASNSAVSYGRHASGYSAQQTDATMVINHSVTLAPLTPSTTYHFIAVSTDAGGDVATSTEQMFTTLPAPDSSDPTATLFVPDIISGTAVITATASDNVGIARVEFYLDDQLAFTSYSPPYQFSLDTLRYANQNYEIKAKAFDLSGRSYLAHRSTDIFNLIDRTTPIVTITAPGSWATVSGEVLVAVSVSDDDALDFGYFWVGSTSKAPHTSWLIGGSKPFPKQAATTLTWNTLGVSNGPVRIAWEIHDKQGNVGWGTRDVTVNNAQPPAPPKLILTDRDVVRHNNYFTVSLTVKNVGGQSATNITIWDYLQLFQPVDDDNSVATIQSTFDPTLMMGKVEIKSKADIPKNDQRVFIYTVVPVMTPQSVGPYASCPYPMIGAYGVCMSNGWKWEGDTHLQYQQPGFIGYFHEWATKGQLIPSTSYFGATTQADYLLVTNPGRLFAFNPGQNSDVNALLSEMARLARSKNGVLGYLAGSDATVLRNTLKNLLTPGLGWAKANWAYRMPKLSQVAGGYLLLVGETEIVPAWHTTGWDRHATCGTLPCVIDDVFYSDAPYADTVGDGAPELIVGRIVGNTADTLANALRTSNRVFENVPGFSFDRSDALLVSGTDSITGNQNSFVDTINAISSTLQGKGFAVNTLHWRDWTATQRVPQFVSRAPNRDVIAFDGHGNVDVWDALQTGDFPLNFGNTNPFVMAVSCLTGDYESGDDYNIVEAFLDSRAAVYVGSTQLSLISSNGTAGKQFFQTWDASETIGKAFTDLKRSLWSSDRWWQFWIAEYNLYGDPKYGAPLSSVVELASAAPAQPLSSLDVTIPDYTVSTRDGLDYVEIPNGSLVLEEDKPQTPSYAVTVDYAPGYKVQAVSLDTRSGLSSISGLILPETAMDWASSSTAPARASVSAGWFPEKDYDWHVLDNADGSSRLVVTLYPFFYNAATTEAQFYKNYTLNVSVTTSSVVISDTWMDKDAYQPGEPVNVSVQLDNTGTARDVVIKALIKRYGTGETVEGLLLATLGGLSGSASFTPQWDSNGKAPGQYYVEVTAQDPNGNMLDRRTERIALGAPEGRVAGLTATPQTFHAGDSVTLSMTFSNTGSVSLTGTALIRVQTTTGTTVQEFKHDIANLAAGSAATLSDIWNTFGASSGPYTVIGYGSYDGVTTEPQILRLCSGSCVYLPLVLR